MSIYLARKWIFLFGTKGFYPLVSKGEIQKSLKLSFFSTLVWLLLLLLLLSPFRRTTPLIQSVRFVSPRPSVRSWRFGTAPITAHDYFRVWPTYFHLKAIGAHFGFSRVKSRSREQVGRELRREWFNIEPREFEIESRALERYWEYGN